MRLFLLKLDPLKYDLNCRLIDTFGLAYIPISPAHPQKENRFILKWWGVKLRVLGWFFECLFFSLEAVIIRYDIYPFSYFFFP